MVERSGVGRVRLHADDVGISRGVNRATAGLLAEGRLVGVSLVANGVATGEAAELVRAAPGVPVHLHFNLTEGCPVSGSTAARRLVGRDGAFLGPHRLVLALVRGDVDPDVVERELEAQLDRLAHLGVPVTGIDSHHHVHAFAPVGEVVERVAARRGLTGGRSYRLLRTHTARGHGKKLLLSLLARTSSWTSAGHGALPASWRTALGDAFAVASWERLDRTPTPGAATVVCHPGGACDHPLPRPNPGPLHISPPRASVSPDLSARIVAETPALADPSHASAPTAGRGAGAQVLADVPPV